MQTPYRGCWLGSGVSCLVMLRQVVTGSEDGGPRLLVKTFGLGVSVGAKGEAHVRPRVLPLSPPLCQLGGSDSSSQGYSGYWTDVLCPISRIATARPDQLPGPSPGALLTRGFEGLERALGSRSQPSHSHTFPLLVHPAGDGLTFTL